MLISKEVTLSGSDFLPCFNNRRALSPLPMFSHLSEYLFKAMKTASKKEKKRRKKKEKKKRKRKTSSTSKDRNLVRLSANSCLHCAPDTNEVQLETPRKGKITRTSISSMKEADLQRLFHRPRVPTPSRAGQQLALAGRTRGSPSPRHCPASPPVLSEAGQQRPPPKQGSERRQRRVRPAGRGEATIFTSP